MLSQHACASLRCLLMWLLVSYVLFSIVRYLLHTSTSGTDVRYEKTDLWQHVQCSAAARSTSFSSRLKVAGRTVITEKHVAARHVNDNSAAGREHMVEDMVAFFDLLARKNVAAILIDSVVLSKMLQESKDEFYGQPIELAIDYLPEHGLNLFVVLDIHWHAFTMVFSKFLAAHRSRRSLVHTDGPHQMATVRFSDTHDVSWLHFSRVQKNPGQTFYFLAPLTSRMKVHLRKDEVKFCTDLLHMRIVDDVYLDTARRVDKSSLSLPADIGGFLTGMTCARYIPCDYKRAAETRRLHKESVSTKELTNGGLAVLKNTRRTYVRYGMRPWLLGGTLLGWYRQCDIIPGSADVDTAVNITELDYSVVGLYNDSAKTDYWLHWLFGRPSELFEMGIYGSGFKADVFFSYHNASLSWVGQHIFKNGRKFRHYYPYSNFTLCSTELLGDVQIVPCNKKVVVDILNADYGQAFMTPNRVNWQYSRPNMVYVGKYSKAEQAKYYHFEHIWRWKMAITRKQPVTHENESLLTSHLQSTQT